MGAFCFDLSIQNWNLCLFEECNYKLFPCSGKIQETLLQVHDTHMLYFVRVVFPKAKIVEINMFIYSVTGHFFDPA